MNSDRQAPLSPAEEVTLRRIERGYAERNEFPDALVHRLVRLGLVTESDGNLELTTQGRLRYQALTRPIGSLPDSTPDELGRLLTMLVTPRR